MRHSCIDLLQRSLLTLELLDSDGCWNVIYLEHWVFLVVYFSQEVLELVEHCFLHVYFSGCQVMFIKHHEYLLLKLGFGYVFDLFKREGLPLLSIVSLLSWRLFWIVQPEYFVVQSILLQEKTFIALNLWCFKLLYLGREVIDHLLALLMVLECSDGLLQHLFSLLVNKFEGVVFLCDNGNIQAF